MIIDGVKKYYGDITALDIEHIELKKGESMALVGANGSGKSTLLRVLAGVISPDGGTVDTQKAKTSYLPQSPFMFDMSVRRNLYMCGDRAKADRLADILSVSRYYRKRATRLSGGETRRIALIRALLTEYELLLLDEPTASLDTQSARACMRLIFDEARGKTLVYTTHSIAEAALADRIALLSGGRCVVCLPSDEFQKTPLAALHIGGIAVIDV